MIVFCAVEVAIIFSDRPLFLSKRTPTSQIVNDNTKKLNSVAFSPQANYTDRATAACRQS
jgi:hypothetical protein